MRDKQIRLLLRFPPSHRHRPASWLPLLSKIPASADRNIVTAGRSFSTGCQAIGYALNQWAALTAYATQGYLAIDNNASERALKRVALGRKNWLFAGHDEAAENAARLWSLIASCERHGIDPQRYLTSVLAKIGQTGHEDFTQFLPDVWAREEAAEPR